MSRAHSVGGITVRQTDSQQNAPPGRSRAGSLAPRMSVLGQSRRFDPLAATSGLPRTTDIRPDRLVRLVPHAEVKWHAIASTMLNDIVQSVVDEVSNYCHGASGASGIAGN